MDTSNVKILLKMAQICPGKTPAMTAMFIHYKGVACLNFLLFPNTILCSCIGCVFGCFNRSSPAPRWQHYTHVCIIWDFTHENRIRVGQSKGFSRNNAILMLRAILPCVRSHHSCDGAVRPEYTCHIGSLFKLQGQCMLCTIRQQSKHLFTKAINLCKTCKPPHPCQSCPGYHKKCLESFCQVLHKANPESVAGRDLYA